MKYRQPAYQPECEVIKIDQCMSSHKKIKPAFIDPLADVRGVRYEPPVMFPGHTQSLKIVVTIESDELSHRIETSPNINDKIDAQKIWIRNKLMEADLERKKAALKQKWDQKLITETNDADASTLTSSTSIATSPLQTEVKEEGEELDLFDGEKEDKNEDVITFDVSTYRAQILDMKERKFLKLREPSHYHRTVSRYFRRRLGFNLSFGYGNKKDNAEVTTVLPWLLLGRAETSENLQYLINQGVTHILNVTSEVPNSHPQQFVYMKLPMRDDESADIGSKFNVAADFMKRVEDKKARIFVHCSAGASRAPSMVMAYLVKYRGISLGDSYNYLRALRPSVNPNNHFLFQLAQFELSLTGQCSVYHLKAWSFFEFNAMRADVEAFRKCEGVYSTTQRLYNKERSEDDLLS